MTFCVHLYYMHIYYTKLITCEVCCMDSTAQKEKEKGPTTELELGTYTLSWSFSRTSHGCAAIQRQLKTRASRLVLCAV